MHDSLRQSKVDTAIVQIHLRTEYKRGNVQWQMFWPDYSHESRSLAQNLSQNKLRIWMESVTLGQIVLSKYYFSFNLSRHLSIFVLVPSIPQSFSSVSSKYCLFLWSFLVFNFFFFFSSLSAGRSEDDCINQIKDWDFIPFNQIFTRQLFLSSVMDLPFSPINFPKNQRMRKCNRIY